jgi:hypothetical protein
LAALLDASQQHLVHQDCLSFSSWEIRTLLAITLRSLFVHLVELVERLFPEGLLACSKPANPVNRVLINLLFSSL